MIKTPNPEFAYELKITLVGTKPPVWRRVWVPGEITLDRLHDIFQIAMGWQDYHLHCFRINGKPYSEKPEEEWEGQEEKSHRLCDLVTSIPADFFYDYDFGDGWQHRVVIESILKVPDGHKALTKCSGGRRQCPPEDVGGVHGFAQFLKACKDPKHPEHKQNLLWVGGAFDPAEFDLNAVTGELRKYGRWSRPRKGDLELEVG
jgi:hypothetical protein